MLKIQNLDVWFFKGTVNEHHGLDHLNLDVETGEFVTLVGSNGAGKSTLFNAICGTIPAQSGRIILDDEEITYLPDHKRA
ncbi:MAG: ATP-binding cassette domain-containing protein, partial [Clostridia bacterium]|nr:ATP-binding cassette domain-containing protein [Clostridia bacterium]